jgi:hypothetical protein
MPTLVARDEASLLRIFEAITAKSDFPFMVKVENGEPRSLKQNKLYHKWMQEIAEQDSDPSHDAQFYTAYCKLHFGVGILKAHDLEYSEFYDKCVKPRDYEEKLTMMREPFGFPVTSQMNVKQMTEYLDKIQRDAAKNGLFLTQPDE